jgi:hypothetical protein
VDTKKSSARDRDAHTTTDPTTRAGDPFVLAGSIDEHPCGCYEGWVYLGFETEEDGELVKIIDRVPCRRCAS